MVLIIVWSTDDGDVGKNSVRKGVFDLELNDEVRLEYVFDCGDDVFRLALGEVDNGAAAKYAAKFCDCRYGLELLGVTLAGCNG